MTAEQRAVREYLIIAHFIERDPEAFIRRLSRLVKTVGECKIWQGHQCHDGYGQMSFWWEGKPVKLWAHRVFLVLMLKHPIPAGYQAGHYNCHNQSCVKHVQLEETADNAKDANQRRHGPRRVAA